MPHRTITYRLLACKVEKARRLSMLTGACRYVWNQMLALQNETYDVVRMYGGSVKEVPRPTFFTLGKDFTQLRSNTPWLQELPFKEVRYTLKCQADAWTAFFKGQRGRPRFKGRKGDDGFTIPSNVKIERNRLWIPRLGWYVLRRHGGNPYPNSVAKTATVKRENGKWYCTVVYEVDLPELIDDGTMLGIDRNIGQLATSEGDILRLPDTSKLEARRKRYQRMMSRRKKGSNRRQKARHLTAKTSRKIAKVKQDWCHQTSRRLVTRASTLVLEDLNVKGMTRSAKGTLEKPGRNVKAKTGLNRAIQATNWSQLERMLQYKAFRVEKVNPMYTSQTCHRCGYVSKDNRPTQSRFTCKVCGYNDNADVNAALNILALGTGATARGEAFSLETSLSREKIFVNAQYG